MLSQSMQALVQRLISKEKQVLQLQTELERARAEIASRDTRAVSGCLLLANYDLSWLMRVLKIEEARRERDHEQEDFAPVLYLRVFH